MSQTANDSRKRQIIQAAHRRYVNAIAQIRAEVDVSDTQAALALQQVMKITGTTEISPRMVRKAISRLTRP